MILKIKMIKRKLNNARNKNNMKIYFRIKKKPNLK